MKKINIWFINPWITDFTAYDLYSKPLGLLYLISFLKKQPVNPYFLDTLDRYHPEMTKLSGLPKTKKYGVGKYYASQIDKPEIIKNIPRHYKQYGMPDDTVEQILKSWPKPHIVFITSLMTYWYPGVWKMCGFIKELYADVPIVVGGVYATLMPEHVKKSGLVDHVIEGSGEEKSLDLIKKYYPDLSYTEDSHKSDIYPAWEFYNKLSYLVVMSSKGCPFKCSFCASHILCNKYEHKHYKNVAEEILTLSQKYHVRDIAFYDDALLMDKENHIKPLLSLLHQKTQNLRFHTPNGIHGKMLDDELAELMFKNNFQTIRISYEFFSEEKKQDISFKISNQEFIDSIKCLEKAGFKRKNIESYIIMGLPGQSIKDVLESMLFIHSQQVQIRLASFSPIPGTEDFNRAVAEKIIPGNLDPLLCNKSIFPLHKEYFSFETYQQLRQFAQVLNEASLRGVNIVKNQFWKSDFLNALINIEKYIEN